MRQVRGHVRIRLLLVLASTVLVLSALGRSVLRSPSDSTIIVDNYGNVLRPMAIGNGLCHQSVIIPVSTGRGGWVRMHFEM